jgi:hypothetical protein
MESLHPCGHPAIAAVLGDKINKIKFVTCVVLFVIRVVLLLILMFCVLLMCKCVLPPGVNPIAVDKYININIKKSHVIYKCLFIYIYRNFIYVFLGLPTFLLHVLMCSCSNFGSCSMCVLLFLL